jgi:hypothetical protein
VVTLDRQYGGVDITHIYKSHNGGLYLYHPGAPPWELRETGPEPLHLNAKQSRSLRDQLNAMDLGDNDEKEK